MRPVIPQGPDELSPELVTTMSQAAIREDDLALTVSLDNLAAELGVKL